MDTNEERKPTVTLRLSDLVMDKLDRYVKDNMAIFASTAVQSMTRAVLRNPETFPPITDPSVKQMLVGKRRTSFSLSTYTFQQLSKFAVEQNTTVVELIRRILYYSLFTDMG